MTFVLHAVHVTKVLKSSKQALTHVLSNTRGLNFNTKTLLCLCKSPYKHTAGQIWFLEKPCRTVHLDGICLQCFKFAVWLLVALLAMPMCCRTGYCLHS